MAERGFNIRKQTGFTQIAIACFVMLYMPIILLVV
jgi:spermidine/putrescine transport system permease protein